MGIELYFSELKLENIGSLEFEKMKDMFGVEEVSDYFEEVLRGDNLDNIEKVNKIMDNYLLSFEKEIDSIVVSNTDKYLADVFLGYLSSIRKVKVFTVEEEKKYGKLLLNNRDVFNILDDDVNNIFVDKNVTKIGKRMLDLEKIFVSIDNEKDKEEILKLLNDYYGTEIRNENNCDKIIKCYLDDYKRLSDKIGGVPNANQLNDYFKNMTYNIFNDFDINKKTNDIDGLKKNLKKYLTYMYARNAMVVHNLKLVCSIAYLYKPARANIMDIINDGNLGLFRAVDNYDYTRVGKFSTFAFIAIKYSIIRERDNTGKMIRMPVRSNEVWRKINMSRCGYTKKYGVDPTPEIIANDTGLSLDVVKKMLYYEENYFVPASLNSISGDDESVEVIECIRSSYLPTDEQAMRNVVSSIIMSVLDSLNDRDRKIIIERFGLDGNGGKTLEEIGMEYGITRERVRQLENNALKKLEKKKEIKKLKGFYKY